MNDARRKILAEITEADWLGWVTMSARTFEHERTENSSTWEFHLHAERDELDGGWVAFVDELPGCVSHGATEDEALANLNEAILLVFEVKLEEALAAGSPGYRRRRLVNRSTAKKPRRLSWWVRPLWTPFEIVVAIVATVVLGYCIGRMW